MNIIDTNRPYTPPPAKQARIDALQELKRIGTTTDFTDQDRDSRVPIRIGGLATYWSKGLCADTPLFVQHAVGTIKRIHLIDMTSLVVGVYDRTERNTCERRALLEKPDEIRASLPRKALDGGAIGEPASSKQQETIRRLLDLPADCPIPPLSAMSASRILDRIVTEKPVRDLSADFQRWLASPRAVAA